MRLLLISILVVIASVVWLAAGRQVTSVLDRLITIRVATLPVSPVRYDGGDLVIGQLEMTFGATDNQRSFLVLCSNSLN